MTTPRSFSDNLALGIARLAVAGLSPKGPGTCGSLVAVLLAPWCFMPLSVLWQLAALTVIFFVGAWAAGRAERILNEKDPGQVVVDELLGQQQIVIKGMPEYLGSVRGAAGLAVLGDGGASIILDIGSLLLAVDEAAMSVGL